LVALTLALSVFSGCSILLPRETTKYIQYPVKSGDNLYGIASRFDVTVSELLDVNDVDPKKLQIGQTLRIPYRGQSLARNGTDIQQSAKAFTNRSNQKVSAGLRKVQLGRAGEHVGKLGWPVDGGSISSRFGWRWLTFHEGIDISAPEGTAVYAAEAGTVVYSGSGLSGYGNLVVIKSNALLTIYAHNDRNLVSVGDRVKRGEQVAEVGATGHATGPHLHFETRIKDSKGKNVAVDPIAFLNRA
jgi:murein DD-endopeptidase MepM/ murein hydrolase activator NlpD